MKNACNASINVKPEGGGGGETRAYALVPFLTAQKSKCPHPGTRILRQIPEGGEGNRGQMPHICLRSPPRA